MKPGNPVKNIVSLKSIEKLYSTNSIERLGRLIFAMAVEKLWKNVYTHQTAMLEWRTREN